MGRWGEEEKKSKGIFGCVIWSGVFLTFCYWFYVNYPNLENRRQLEKDMQNIIRTGANKEVVEMKAQIRDAALNREVALGPDDLELEKWLDDNGNFVVKCRIEYQVSLDLFITDFQVAYPIREQVTIVY